MTFEMTDQVLRRLTDDTLVWLTTVTPSGRPAPRLVWFMWLDGASDPSQDAARLASSRSACLIYSQPGAAKLRHIAVNDRVTLNFNSNELGGDAVVLAGRAELVPDAPSAAEVPGLLAKYAEMLAAIGMTAEHFTGTYTVAMRVIPDHAWTVSA